MRFRASTAGGLGLTLLCGGIIFSGCSSDSGSGDRPGGATNNAGSTTGGSGGSAGATTSKGGSGGSTGGSGGSGGSAPAVCPSATPVTIDLISEFDGAAATFMGDEINGGYYAYGDPAGGTTTPDTSTPPTMLTPEAGDHDGNALHFSGEGFPAASWGAGFGIWFSCADGSAVDGISFWVKNDQPLRVGATIPGTQAATDGGECTAASCMPNSFTVEPHAEWTLVEIPWASFTGGTVAFSESKVLGVDILIPTPSPATADWGFDVWVDDLKFMGGEPAGTGGASGDGGTTGGGGAPTGGGAGGDPSAVGGGGGG